MPKPLLPVPILVNLLYFRLDSAEFQKGKAAYDRGDFETALKEWQPLVEKGDAYAQVILCAMYAKGRGRRQDYVLAHMWANRAAAQGIKLAIDARSELGRIMTRKQLADAQALAREWKPKLVPRT